MASNRLTPTLNQNFRIEHSDSPRGGAVDFSSSLARSRKAEQEGRYEDACEIRFEAMQALVELLPDDEPIELDWEDRYTRDAILSTYYSAVDHFLVSDWEMAAAGFEMVLDVDSDDHLEATTLLAFTYIALGEWECFDDILPDISDKSPERSLLVLWSDFVRTGTLNRKELTAFGRYHSTYLNEWRAEQHPTDGEYLADIDSDHPSKKAQARELWLQTEHLWAGAQEFIEALKKA